MEPGADGCGSGRMSVAFSLAWLKPPLELLQTGVNLHRKARGPCASTKMEPEADGCGSGRMSVAFSLAWLKPPLELLQTGVDLRHKARGPCASTKVEPANDRPSLLSVLVQTSTRPSAAPGCQAGFGSL